jgi:hypothetical protein
MDQLPKRDRKRRSRHDAAVGYYMTGNTANFDSHNELFDGVTTAYSGFTGHKEDAYVAGTWTESP